MLQLVRSVLEVDGYDCLTASSGEEALTVINSTPAIMVAISDINMPGMNGMLFLKKIGSHASSSSAPRVVFLTAHPCVDFAVAALRLGALDFLTKPIRSQELLTAVRNAVARVRRDRAALQLPDQVATLAQQAEALAATLRGWTRSQPEMAAQRPVVAGEDSGTEKGNDPGRPGNLALLGLNHLRRPRDSFAPLDDLDEIAWDLLLELLRAEKSSQRFSVSALSISVEHVSPTTALRRIQELVKLGHVVRSPDPMDARRDFVALAPQSRAALEHYREHVAEELAAAVAVAVR